MSPPVLRNAKPKGNDLNGSESPSNSPVTVSALRSLKADITMKLANMQKSAEENLIKIMNSFEERIMQRLSDITAEVANLRSELHSTKTKLANVTKRCDCMETDLDKARALLNTYENSLYETDFVVGNVPNNHDATVVVNKLLTSITCEGVGVRNVFRTHKTSDNDKRVPIIVKLNTSDDRVKVFRALALFRKKTKKQLSLSDIGISADASIFVHECLTSLNRELLRNALHYKSTKLLEAAFSLRGVVYVRVKAHDKATKINSVAELTKIVGGA